MKIKILKFIDRLFGFVITACIPSAPAQPFFTPKRIILIRPGGIGDAVLLVPAIKNLKKNFHNIHITILAEQRNSGVFALTPDVDEVLCYDSFKDFIRALCGRFDIVIDTEQWYRLSAVVARLVKAPVKIGFDTNERRRMFTHTIKYFQDQYETKSFNHLLAPLGLNEQFVQSEATFLTIPESASEKTTSLLKPLGCKPFVVIFPGASSTEKRWAPKQFNAVANQLIKDGYQVVIIGGQEDVAEGKLIERVGGLNLAGMTTLAETAAVIARSKLVISGDSGVLHLAVGLGIPTVSLFGPSNSAKWAPKGEKHIVLSRNLDCSPCSKFGTIPPCPHNVRCMKEITADQVVEAAVTLLQKYSNKNQD